jgi:hypothetical protein
VIISAYWRGLSNRPARFCWRFVAQRGMRPDVVVVVSPDGQLALGIGQAVEYLFVVAFVAQAAVEALDECVLLRFEPPLVCWRLITSYHATISNVLNCA